jgi:dTDP-4-dehydrorhamnose reductase
MSPTLLITGASGYLGGELARQAYAAGWHVVGTYWRGPLALEGVHWQRLDVRDRAAVAACVATARPDVVVHAAVAEPNDWTVNADGSAHVALAARAQGSRLVHMSSDAIFSGTHGLYDEAAVPEPLMPYGAAKAAAETAVQAIMPEAAIVRTSLIVGARPYKHVQMVLDLVTGKRTGALFTDEIRCPILVENLAAALLELLEHPYSGVLNIAGADALSRYELGVLIARRWGYDSARLRATTTTDSGMRRPTDVRLDIHRAQTLLNTPLQGARGFIAALNIEHAA